jgi:hypothetical protein
VTDFPAIKAMLEALDHGTASTNAAWREYERIEATVYGLKQQLGLALEQLHTDREAAYGAAGRAAGETVLQEGRDGARLRPANDAYLLSRIARACVDAVFELDASDA